MVGAVGEMAYTKRRKLWKMEEDGLCCSNSAIQTRPGPSSLLEERSITPIVFVVFFVLSATPQTGGHCQGNILTLLAKASGINPCTAGGILGYHSNITRRSGGILGYQ